MTSEHNEQGVTRPDASAAEHPKTQPSTAAACPDLDTLLSLGTASGWQLAILQHVPGCAQCRIQWAELAEVRDAFDESQPMPAAFDDRVLAAIGAQVRSRVAVADQGSTRRRGPGELLVHACAAGLTTFVALAPLTRPDAAGGLPVPLLSRVAAALLIGSLALILIRRLPSGVRPA